MIKKMVLLAFLVAISGALIFGGVHRTQAVLAKEGGGSESVQIDGTETHDTQTEYEAQTDNDSPGEYSSGNGRGGSGLRDGSGRGRRDASGGYTD